MASTEDLVLSRKGSRRKLKSANFGWLAIIGGLLGLVGVGVFFLVWGANKSDSSAMTGMPSSHQATQRAPEEAAQASTFSSFASPAAAATAPPATPEPASVSGGGGGGGVSREQGDPDAREARRRALERQQQEARDRQQRMDAASGSLGSVAIAKVDDAAPDATGTPAATEYAAPAGPVLALDTTIPVSISQSLDSTFTGSFVATVTDDVRDETGATVLIPRGSHCYGKTAQGGVDGQQRIFLSANLCKLPNRERIALADFPAIDVDGATGLKARVDDHGAGRRGRGSLLMGVPQMLVGTVVPGFGGSVASGAMSAAAQASAGRAIPGPTLYVDASPQKPRSFALLATADTQIGGSQ